MFSYKQYPKPSEVKIYYNPGVMDCYTVIINNRDVYGASKDPEHPLGVLYYIGRKSDVSLSSLGRRVAWEEVPDSLKRWIIKKLKEI